MDTYDDKYIWLSFNGKLQQLKCATSIQNTYKLNEVFKRFAQNTFIYFFQFATIPFNAKYA